MIAEPINAERLVIAGWPRAILLEMAHPLIAAGVAEHSAFRADTLTAAQRLIETVRAMLRLTFGTPPERQATIEKIRAIHRRVNGRLHRAVGSFPAGTPYSAEDPALVLWVHATVVESTIIAHDALVRPVPVRERDLYCAESAWVASALGVDERAIPQNWEDLQGYMGAVLSSGQLTVGDEARMIADALLGKSLTMLAGPGGWGIRQLTRAWLPSDLRMQYGLSWTERDAGRAVRLASRVRRFARFVPGKIRRWSYSTVSPHTDFCDNHTR